MSSNHLRCSHKTCTRTDNAKALDSPLHVEGFTVHWKDDETREQKHRLAVRAESRDEPPRLVLLTGSTALMLTAIYVTIASKSRVEERLVVRYLWTADNEVVSVRWERAVQPDQSVRVLIPSGPAAADAAVKDVVPKERLNIKGSSSRRSMITPEQLSSSKPPSGIFAPRGLQRKMRHQIQAMQQMIRPTARTTRSATFLLSQRTKKKPRMTSTPHRLYIRLLLSSPKLKRRCVRGVTMMEDDGHCSGRAVIPARSPVLPLKLSKGFEAVEAPWTVCTPDKLEFSDRSELTAL
ncbi:hypothetical protein EYF80_035428 [Liparis tanakae]|uniref:Uncharacterized protein n=1 Tax=Liparis tanakae TaxID=230148 RepID=A0A4Z2GL80_9TELE|nr:hypothetical protein EYF80_035428 [Liparis tanakae]